MQMVQKSTGQIVTVPDTVGPISVGPNGDPMQLIPYGYLLLPVPVADGFVRIATGYVDSGDRVHSIPFPPDMAQADYDAQQQAAAQAAAIAQTAANAAAQAATLPQRQAVATLQSEYAAFTNQFCTAAGITPVVNVLDIGQISTAIQTASLGSAMANSLTTVSLALEALRTRLIEATGDQHALDAIPVTGAITIPSV